MNHTPENTSAMPTTFRASTFSPSHATETAKTDTKLSEVIGCE